MKKKIYIVGGSELEPLFGLLSLFAGLMGAEVRTEEVKGPEVSKPFDETTYTKPFLPKVLVGYERSNSHPGVSYRIVKDKEGNLYCNCKGFVYRGTCRHVEAAKRKLNKPDTYPKEGITVRRFNSRTKAGVVYDVNLLNGRFVCTCPGFQYHDGTCKHVEDVKKSIRFPGSV